MGDHGLISVRTEVVLDTLVGSLADAVAARLGEPLDAVLEEALRATRADGKLARRGYFARAAEIERFERAREPMPWLTEAFARTQAGGMGWAAAAARLATALAAEEPPERPDPDDRRAVSWRVPGPGGHVRHYLAVRAAGEERQAAGAVTKRGWLAGFLVHCIREAAPDP